MRLLPAIILGFSAQNIYDPRSDLLYRAYLIATILGVLVALGALCILYAQTKATQETLRLTHRPKIVVRNIVIPELARLNRKTAMTQWTQNLTGHYTVVNTGGLPATITRLIEGTWCGKTLPMERPDRGHSGKTVAMKLSSGESREIDFGNIFLAAEDTVDLIDADTKAFFLVQVEYIDEERIKRRTSACRCFDPTTNAFTIEMNPDYEC
jgi:hypothetical protein